MSIIDEYKNRILGSKQERKERFERGPSENLMAKQRLLICSDCDSFRETTKTCSECNCFMPLKARLNRSICPLGKWGLRDDDYNAENGM